MDERPRIGQEVRHPSSLGMDSVQAGRMAQQESQEPIRISITASQPAAPSVFVDDRLKKIQRKYQIRTDQAKHSLKGIMAANPKNAMAHDQINYINRTVMGICNKYGVNQEQDFTASHQSDRSHRAKSNPRRTNQVNKEHFSSTQPLRLDAALNQNEHKVKGVTVNSKLRVPKLLAPIPCQQPIQGEVLKMPVLDKA